MKLTTKHKAYGSVAALCVGAFVVDKAFLGPSEAMAASPAEAALAAAPGVDAAPGAPAVGASLGGVARQLAAVADSIGLDPASVPDAFEPGPSWRPAEPEVEPEPAVPVVPPEQIFQAAHRLTAVMAAGESGHAVVDGRGLRVGQRLDGFTLVRIDERSAVFEQDGRTAVLAIEEADKPAGGG